MTITDTPVDNGVNTEALLGARDALSEAPEAAEFTWRATCSWVHGTHSRTTVDGFSGLGQDHSTARHVHVRRRPSRVLRLRGQRRHAGRVRARRAGQLPHRRRRRRRPAAADPAALGHGHRRGHMNVLGILGADPDIRNGFDGVEGALRHRRRRVAERHRGDRRPVAEALRRVRHHHQPDRTSSSRSPEPDGVPTDIRQPVIIGAGHAGLAMSRRLTDRSIDHVVLERGEVANSWRTERWDSLRLLTPNWHTRLPGRRYDGVDPDGFMSMPEVVSFISGYAANDRRAGARRDDGDRLSSARATATRSSPTAERGRAPASCSRAGPATSPRSRRSPRRVPDSVESLTPLSYRNADGAGARRRAGGRRLGNRRAVGRRDPPHRPARHTRRRRARPDAADVPGTRHLLVDRPRRHPRRAPRRDRRSRPRPAPAVAPTDRHTGTALDRPQLTP